MLLVFAYFTLVSLLLLLLLLALISAVLCRYVCVCVCVSVYLLSHSLHPLLHPSHHTLCILSTWFTRKHFLFLRFSFFFCIFSYFSFNFIFSIFPVFSSFTYHKFLVYSVSFEMQLYPKILFQMFSKWRFSFLIFNAAKERENWMKLNLFIMFDWIW